MAIRHQLPPALSCAILLVVTVAASGQSVFDWNGSSNDSYGNVFNWTPLGVPDNTTESARFDIAGSFDVTLSSGTTTTVSDLIVNDGDITFAANAAIFATYATADDVLINSGEFSLSRSGGAGNVRLSVGDELLITGGGQLLVDQSSDVTVGRVVTIVFDSSAIIDGAGSTWTVDSDLSVGSVGLGSLMIQNQANVDSGSGSIGGPGASGVATVDGAGSAWTTTGGLTLGSDASGGMGTLLIQNGADVANGFSTIRAGDGLVSSVTVTGIGSSWDSGPLSIRNGNLSIAGNGLVMSEEVTLGDNGASAASINNVGSQWFTTDLTIGGASGAASDSGILSVNGGQLEVDGALTLWANGEITLAGGAITVNGPVAGEGGVLHFDSGTLALIDPTQGLVARPDGLHFGTLSLDQSTIDFTRQLGVAGSRPTLVMPGATLTQTGGGLSLGALTITTGGSLSYQGGSFNTAGPVQAAIGSVIDIESDVTFGDSTSVGGVVIAGALNTGDNTVNLKDANDAVFDSGANVTLGDGAGGSANLIIDNGLTLDFGGNISGFGTITTPDDPATPVINNGHITGDSLAEPIMLTGYMKGVGTCDNCNITGTDSPGFSPATVLRGSVNYNGVLEIELGGAAVGDFDRLEHILGAGVADLGGELDVLLLDGFMPQLGDTFEFLTATGGVTGEFTLESSPDLGPLLTLAAIYQPNSVTLVVVPELSGDYNAEGTVDAIDYALWRESLGQTGVGLAADGDQSGVVDSADFDLWNANYGAMLVAASESNIAAPEPASLMLLALVAVRAAWQRRTICDPKE